MKRNIWFRFLLAGMIFALVSTLICLWTLHAALPEKTPIQWAKIMLPVVLELSIVAVVLSTIFTDRIYAQSLRPLRMMVKYLNGLLSGKVTDEVPTLEAEEALGSLLETNKERTHFLQQLANVRENENMRRQFSANVSHELKSPLTSINGYAEMIESGMVGSEDTRRFAGIIHREGIRLLNMINEIIQLSKFDTGYSDFDQREEFDLHKALLQEMETLGSMAQDHHVKLHVDVEGTGKDQEVRLFGNRRLMTDVLRNLLSNAIKYSKPEGGYVLTKLRQDEDNILIIVEDDGIGIAPENQERIFERFYVVDPGRTRTEGSGTGLGLSLVKHIVQVHGGTLTLESALGKGSRFTISLPRRQQEAESVAIDTPEA